MSTPRLSRDRVVETALSIAAERGLDRVSMRAIAARLEVVPMALYRHVPDRESLVALAVDTVGALVTVHPVAGEAWDDGVRRWALAHRHALVAYPGTAEWLIAHGPAGSHAFRIADGYAAHLLAAGLRPEQAARAFTTIVTWVLARCASEDRWRNAHQDREGIRRRMDFASGFRAEGGDAYPAAAAIANEFASLSVDEAFGAGLDIILDGIRGLIDSNRR